MRWNRSCPSGAFALVNRSHPAGIVLSRWTEISRFTPAHHVERLDPEVFTEIQTELQMDARRAAVACEFPAAHRMQTAPLSVIQADANGRSLAVHAFHTFPENAAVVRTQTLYEF